jgi:hypothetical protein
MEKRVHPVNKRFHPVNRKVHPENKSSPKSKLPPIPQNSVKSRRMKLPG